MTFLEQKIKEYQLKYCTCDEAYKGRALDDPYCHVHDGEWLFAEYHQDLITQIVQKLEGKKPSGKRLTEYGEGRLETIDEAIKMIKSL